MDVCGVCIYYGLESLCACMGVYILGGEVLHICKTQYLLQNSLIIKKNISEKLLIITLVNILPSLSLSLSLCTSSPPLLSRVSSDGQAGWKPYTDGPGEAI